MEATPRVWLIAGPTASGKSALAVALAVATGAEIVNADAMQVYRDLRILTARPSPAEELQAPHRLYGVAGARDAWSVGRWLRAVRPQLDRLIAEGRPAIVVGGTGLYFSALTRGLADIPAVDEALRARLSARLELDGEAAFRSALYEVDADSAAAIAAGDRQRLVRALSVHAASGRSLSDWRRAPTAAPLAQHLWRGVVLAPDRPALYAACDARLEAMVHAGALEEVDRLLSQGLEADLPIMKATGLRELARHVAGELTLDQALEQARRQTRRYAKRQTTWFRHQACGWTRLAGAPDDAMAATARAAFANAIVGDGA